MLMAFVLGFWCLWMGEREPSVLLEGLFFAIIAIVGNGFMQWKVPDPDTVWALQWGLVWVWAAVMMYLVDGDSRGGRRRLFLAGTERVLLGCRLVGCSG